MARRPFPAVPTLAGPLAVLNPWLLWIHRQVTEAISSYEDLQAAVEATGDAAAHASSHIRGGSDQVDGDLVDVDYVPTNYTRTTDGTATHAEHLRAHLVGVNAELGDHETRIGTLEAEKYRTTTYSWRGSSLTQTAGATFYITPYFASGGGSIGTLADAQLLWGRAGTFKNLRYKNISTTGDADTFDLTVNINGSDTSLSITGIAGNVGTMYSNTSNTATVAAGDLFAIKQVNGSIISVLDYSITFDFVEDP